MLNLAIRAIPPVLFVLCLLAFLPWVLGVPGTDNLYAKGWMIGLYALLGYVAVYAIILLLHVAARLGWLTVPPGGLATATWIAIGGFVIAQIVAWVLILQ